MTGQLEEKLRRAGAARLRISDPQSNPRFVMSCMTCAAFGSPRVLVSCCKTYARSAELERALICERVKAGLRHARAHGKRLGRPKKPLDAAKIAWLRKQGKSWRKIASIMECSAKTCRRIAQNTGAKTVSGTFAPPEDEIPTPESKEWLEAAPR